MTIRVALALAVVFAIAGVLEIVVIGYFINSYWGGL